MHDAGQGRPFQVLNEELEPRASALLGAVDTIGLVNNHIWRTGAYTAKWGAWPDRMLGQYPDTCRGFVPAGFDRYSALLHAGIDLKLSAGSASGVHPVPPGRSRIYVRTRAKPTVAGWFDAVRAGMSLVTTGPMLLLRVNGKEPGDEIRGLSFPATVDIEVEMLSTVAVDHVKVVVNGAVHSIAMKRDTAKARRYRGRLRTRLTDGAWITARRSADRAGSCDAAHRSPVFLGNGGGRPPMATSNEKPQRLERHRRDGARVDPRRDTRLIRAGSRHLLKEASRC